MSLVFFLLLAAVMLDSTSFIDQHALCFAQASSGVEFKNKKSHSKTVGTSTSGKNTNNKNHEHHHQSPLLILAMYHKTGYELTNQLSKLLVSNGVTKRTTKIQKLGYTDKEMHRDLDSTEEPILCPGLHSFSRDPGLLYRVQSGDFFCDDWAHSVRGATRFSIAHLVRDPYAMCVSSFVYHTQEPTPEKSFLKVHPCFHERKLVEYIAKKIGVTMHEIDGVVDLCRSLYLGHKGNYYETLKSMDRFDALRLHCAHFLIHFRGGTILKMAANTIELSKLKHQSALSTYHLTNFTGDDSKIRHTLESLLHFLFRYHEDVAWVPRVIDAYMEGYHKKVLSKSNHITNTVKEHSERSKMTVFLQSDVVLSPVLNKVLSVIQSR